ncbi:DNA (cytosine-5-)-methyltransferase [Capnocytophaga canimorsus]|uniref:DNA (cytosine-5-)-methyltransferase n=1 Tax=Capnocytophaga canimorsus TaxID=28188 RepID=UPI0037D0FB0E
MKAIHLFGGIGGFAKGFEQAGYEFTEHYFSEIDKHAIANYKYNFPNAKHIGNAKSVRGEDFEGIDIITAGFPCQPFSTAGKRRGFEDARGTLFFEIARICSVAKPKFLVLENVKGLLNHDGGRTISVIYQTLSDIGYSVEFQVVNTKWFLPQNRERIYLVGHLATNRGGFRGVFPIGENLEKRNVNNIEATIKVGTLRTHNDGKGFREVKSEVCPTIPARARQDGSGQPVILSYTRDGKGKVINRNERSFCNTLTQATGGGGNTDVFVKQLPRGKNKGNDFETCPTISSNAFQENNFVSGIRRLTEIECERLQGFPDDYTKFGNYDGTIKEIAKTQRYKMLGNAVSVPVVEEIAIRLKSSL